MATLLGLIRHCNKRFLLYSCDNVSGADPGILIGDGKI